MSSGRRTFRHHHLESNVSFEHPLDFVDAPRPRPQLCGLAAAIQYHGFPETRERRSGRVVSARYQVAALESHLSGTGNIVPWDAEPDRPVSRRRITPPERECIAPDFSTRSFTPPPTRRVVPHAAFDTHRVMNTKNETISRRGGLKCGAQNRPRDSLGPGCQLAAVAATSSRGQGRRCNFDIPQHLDMCSAPTTEFMADGTEHRGYD